MTTAVCISERSLQFAPVREYAADTFSCQLRCHDPSGEVYFVTFSRESVRITSYQDDAILEKVDAWADGVPALA